MKKITIMLVLLVGIMSYGQEKPVLEKVYWFTTGIEKQGSDLLLDNPAVFSEIITVVCDRSYLGTIANKFEKFFEAEHASKQRVTGVFLYPFAFLTLAEAQTKRNEIKANVESKNQKIYLVNNFKANCD